MMDGFFKQFDENTFIDEDAQLDTLRETEILRVFNRTPANIRLSYIEILSTSLNLNFEHLYTEVLKGILDSIKDTPHQKLVTEFAKDVFGINKMTHEKICKSIDNREVLKCMLNIEIIKGEIFESKNEISFSNPFCTFYLESSPQHKFNTSFKSQTLQPVWDEHLSIPLNNSPNDTLFVEMWNFIPDEENISRKAVKPNPFKAIMNILKRVVFSRHVKKPIGFTKIPFKTISSKHCIISSYSLINSKENIQQGKLLMKISFVNEKKEEIAIQEHRQLLRVLLDYQINKQKIQMHSWMGNFLMESEIIIRKHEAWYNINPKEAYLDKWIEFIDIQMQNPVISPKVFSDVLNNLLVPLKSGELSDRELKTFWQSTKKIMPFCYNVIRAIRRTPPGDEKSLNQIESVLNILQLLQSLDAPNWLDLFSTEIYDWLLPSDHVRDIRSTLHDAVIRAALDWHVHISENYKPEYETEETELEFQLKMIRLFKLDLDRAEEFHDKLFIEKMQIRYSSTIFLVYDSKITERCESFVKCAFMNMMSINVSKKEKFQIDDDSLATATLLFTLYIRIQKFIEHGKNLGIDSGKSRLMKYDTWFQEGVAGWLDIFACMAVKGIDKAVDLDKLAKIDSSVGISSSAVDVLTVFYNVFNFWRQLAWPDAEVSYSFVAKIIDNICHCSLYYADKIGHKVGNVVIGNEKFEVTREWCLAVNNIEHVKRSIRAFVDDSIVMELMEKLVNDYSGKVNPCKRTLDHIIDCTVESLNGKIESVLRVVVNKMIPCISTFLNEGGEVTHKKNKHLDNLIQYLDDSLCTLREELNEKNFEHIFNIIIASIGNSMFNVVNTNLKKKKRCTYFRNLRDNFHILFGFLKDGKETEDKNVKIQELEELLDLHALYTVDLIHEYYLQKIQEQKEMREPTEGVLTVKLMFIDNVLVIEILNAHRLKAMDSNGSSDPFVTVSLLPRYKFQNVICPKTTVQKQTLSPLFDSTFKIPLAPEQRNDKHGIVEFVIEHNEPIGFRNLSFRNEFMSEAFVHLKNIPSMQSEYDMDTLPQIKLNMTVSKSLDWNVLKVLSSRINDRLAVDFIKRVKAKLPASN